MAYIKEDVNALEEKIEALLKDFELAYPDYNVAGLERSFSSVQTGLGWYETGRKTTATIQLKKTTHDTI